MGKSDVFHGSELIQRGWTQGSLIENTSAPKVYTVQTLTEQARGENIEAGVSLSSNQWKLKEKALAESDWLVVVSQDCDIQKEANKEPFVEAVRAFWTGERDIIRQASTNSVCYFPLKERTTSDNRAETLVVDLRDRLLIEKEALLKCPPIPYFDHENDASRNKQRHFRQWLGRRYLRQALENELVEAIQKPVVKAIRDLRKRDPLQIQATLNKIQEIRFHRLDKTVPYQIEILFLFETSSPTEEEIASNADNETSPPSQEEIASLADWLDGVLKREGKAELVHWDIHSTQQISVYDYAHAYELSLDEFSLP